MTAENFDEKVFGGETREERGNWFVKFYDPESTKSQAMANDWEQIADGFNTKVGNTATIADVNCAANDANLALCKKYKIEEFPELRWFGRSLDLGEFPVHYKGPHMVHIMRSYLWSMSKKEAGKIEAKEAKAAGGDGEEAEGGDGADGDDAPKEDL